MKKIKNRELVEAVITTVLSGLLVYAAYSLWYIFYGTDSGSDVHLYTVLSGVALGWFMLLFVQTAFKKTNLWLNIGAFLAGNALFQGLIWGINAKVNQQCLDNDVVIIKTFTVTFVLSAILLLVTFVLRAKTKCKTANIVLAAIYFLVCCCALYNFNAENIRGLEYKKNIQFDSISADEMKISDGEKQLCADWYNDNFSLGIDEYPFTFKVDGEVFNPADWENIQTKKFKFGAVYNGGQTEYLMFSNDEKELELTVETTVFADSATCQWTVYIKNTGDENSGVISDFYALDSSFATGNAELYYSMGSNTAASDFSLIKKNLTAVNKKFSGVDGKPTEKYLPYFNISGENYGMILGVGWTGQWAASMSESKGNTDISVKQEHFEAYLLPGEAVRSPLVSVSFYENTNPLKGFNLFRNWVMDCVYPENITKNHYTVMEVAGPMSTKTSDEIIEILDGIGDDVYAQTDALWMDAGWYEYTDGWYDGVGNWTVDKSRYDNGISELSGYGKEKGLGHVLWYEPERVYKDTQFYNVGSQHEQWLIDVGEDNFMWNLADSEALAYYCNYLVKSLKDNGVTIYRQDFNFAPLKYWQKADAEYYDGRTGICENHYVTNLYEFLDFLTENIDGLIIDNCASGGKRLDLEMTYRSIPFWRSDYNCSVHSDLFEATQSQTYGISFWLPVSGTAFNMTNEYSSRSDIMPLFLMDFYAHSSSEFDFYHEQRDLMTGNYYPLEFGSFDKNKMLAMEYISTDGTEGMALVYKRAKVNDDTYILKLNGLETEKNYKLYDFDKPETVYTMTGQELMEKGIDIDLPEGEKAVIVMFKVT